MIEPSKGYYWAREKRLYGKSDYWIVEVRFNLKGEKEVWVIGYDTPSQLYDFDDWIGPLKPPKIINS